MEGSVLEVHEPQELLMQFPQRDLVRQASQSPPQTHLADEERPHGTRHYGSVEPKAFVLEPRLDVGENGQLFLDGCLKVFRPAALPTEMRP
jgi:hypothetical protein